MTEYKLIAMDTSKHVFTLHGVDEYGKILLRRELRRQQLDGVCREFRVRGGIVAWKGPSDAPPQTACYP